jgi:hypothetical protein
MEQNGFVLEVEVSQEVDKICVLKISILYPEILGCAQCRIQAMGECLRAYWVLNIGIQ